MKFISKIKYLLLPAIILLGMSACMDEFEQPELIGDGTATIEFAMNYKQMDAASLGETRSQRGDLIGDINNGIFVVWYSNDGKLVGCKFYDNDQLTISEVSRDEQADCDQKTQRATFKNEIPYGRYRIYTAVNMGDLNASHHSDIQTEAGFKAIRFDWDNNKIANNCQMSGYFTTTLAEEYANEAPLVTINQPNVSLHAWVRRAASKVTVAFDASALNDNIYICLKSATIKDIPNSCLLMDNNTPTSKEQLIAVGDNIEYGTGTDYSTWPRISCGREAAKYGSHAADAPALFFYENMQGKHEGKHNYAPDTLANGDLARLKDDVPYGTYLEVVGYYVNQSDVPSKGNIIYRCMLGKNMTDDFNSERNVHYKVTLKFNKDANDVDWHIDYDYIPRPPELIIPTPQFISYQYNRELLLPITLISNKDEWEVTEVRAKIIENEALPKEHRHHDDAQHKETYNGFLSLKFDDVLKITDNKADFEAGGEERTYDVKTYTEVEEGVIRYNVPVYTRPLELAGSFSGCNIWPGAQLYAKVRVTVKLKNKLNSTITKTISEDVQVIQVKRLLNPAGVWRSAGSDKPFRVAVKGSEVDRSSEELQEFSLHLPTNYVPLISEGPWTAEIVVGQDWVRIKDIDSGTWGNTPVTGGTGSEVVFDYKPASTISTTATPRFGAIQIKYHNNNCYHWIMVSQGNGLVDVGTSVRWAMTNMKYAGVDEENPLLEGSMFKYGNVNYAFASTNSLSTARGGRGFGYNVSTYNIQGEADKKLDYYDANGNFYTGNKGVTFNSVGATKNANFASIASTEKNGRRIATVDDWTELNNLDKFEHVYGVLYGDECEETLTAPAYTTTYTHKGDKAGMLGIFIYSNKNGNHLFFPLGNTCYGRRKWKDQYGGNSTTPATEVKYGNLKYSDRTIERPSSTSPGYDLPTYYYLYRSPGVIYWFALPVKRGNYWHYGWDMNYMTYGFAEYTTDRVQDGRGEDYANSGQHTDACFVRRVEQ